MLINPRKPFFQRDVETIETIFTVHKCARICDFADINLPNGR